MSHILRLLFTLFFLLSAATVYAYELTLGGSINQHIIEIREKTNRDQVGEFKSELYITPAFGLSNEPQYFGSSNFGWLIELNVGGYRVNRQINDDGRSENLGTGMHGYFGHFTPILFYRFGDKYMRGSRHWSLTVGPGYGFSFLYVDGDFYTNRENEIYDSDSRVEVDNAMGFFLLPAVITRFTYYNWFAGFSACFGGPGFEQDNFTYRLVFRTLTLGYIFEF